MTRTARRAGTAALGLALVLGTASCRLDEGGPTAAAVAANADAMPARDRIDPVAFHHSHQSVSESRLRRNPPLSTRMST